MASESAQPRPSIGGRIAAARGVRGLSQARLADHMGVTRSAVAQWESDVTVPAMNKLRRLADVLQCDAAWLMGDAAAGPEARPPQRVASLSAPAVGGLDIDMPVLGVAGASGLEGLDDDLFEINGSVIEHVRRPPGLARVPHAFCIYVVGSSMAPRHRPGDLVYVHPARPPAVGDDVVIELRDPAGGERRACLLKELAAKYAGGFRFRQYNPARELKLAEEQVLRLYKVLTLKELLGA